MLLTVDIGNSNIVFELMQSKDEVIQTIRTQTVKEENYNYKDVIFQIFHAHKIECRQIDGIMLSSVVPEITFSVKRALDEITKKNTIIVNYKLHTGIQILTDYPEKVGNDLIVDAVCGINEYEGNLIIFDLGTATTCSVIDDKHNYLGTVIMPGMAISGEALSKRASQLPEITYTAPEHIIGKNTIESMQSGLIYGHASMLDGFVRRIKKEIGEDVTVLATGGIARLILPYCEEQMIYEPDMLPKGLWYLYEQNT